MLQHIIPSKARRKMLELFFLHPGDTYYLRRIVREIGEEVNAVKRELDILTDEHLLHRERRLNKIFYSLNKNYLYYDEFLRIFTKNDPLSLNIYKNQSKIGKIKYVALSVKFSKRLLIKEDEIYLLIVGVVVVPEVAAIVAEAEKSFGHEINYTVMTEDEFIFRKKNNDPFLWRFLKSPKTMLIGGEDEFMK